MSDSAITGACLCGAVAFSVEPPTLGSAHCHCPYCRRAHGAPLVTWLVAEEARFTVERGADTVKWHQSSEQSRRGFCRECGTTMFFASTLCPGEIHIAYGALLSPADRLPKAHVFTEHRVAWFDFNDALAHYRGDGPELAKYRAVNPLRKAD